MQAYRMMEYVFLSVGLVAVHKLNIKVIFSKNYSVSVRKGFSEHMFVYIGINMPVNFKFICVPHVHHCM